MNVNEFDVIAYAERIEYGNLRRRIVNDTDAVRAFRALTGRTTLTDSDIHNLPKLGARLVCVYGRIPGAWHGALSEAMPFYSTGQFSTGAAS